MPISRSPRDATSPTEDDRLVESVEAALAGEHIAPPQPPWLEPGDLVRLVDDGRRGLVLGVETGYFGTLYRVRVLNDDGSVHELPRDALEKRSAVEADFVTRVGTR